jgi:hypothetical protein
MSSSTTGPYAGPPSTVVSACEREGRGNDVRPADQLHRRDRNRRDRRSGQVGARDEQYGHLTVEDDPEGTTDEAELLSRHRSQDEA